MSNPLQRHSAATDAMVDSLRMRMHALRDGTLPSMASDVPALAGHVLLWMEVASALEKRVADLEEALTRPRARTGDPETSHEAASLLRDRPMTERRMAVMTLLRESGPATDEELIRTYNRVREHRGWPQQSESGLRTRRSELVRLGQCVADGTCYIGGRRRNRWRAV